MFVVDKSSSNVEGNLGDVATDPNEKKRADNIERFWLKKKSNPLIKWSFIAFHNWEANSYIGTDAVPLFSGDPRDMQSAIQQQRNNPDTGETPYQAALTEAQKAIQIDLQKNPKEDSDYMVFFISDGYPDDGGFTHPVGATELAMVDSLMNSAKGKIHLSTAYYGPNDPQGPLGLQAMAQHGQGKFVNLNTNPDFNIDDLLVNGPTGETYIIKPGSLVVYNVNSAICFDGTVGVDSDGDGLCDKDEMALGKPYDPQNRFSFGDGYGDYVHYAAKIARDTLIPCQDRTDEDNDLLTKCEESYMKNNSPSGTTSVAADPLNPDTDGDGIIDGIEFFMLHSKSVALDKFNLFQNFDSELVNAGDQIRQHRNPIFPDPNLSEDEVYDTKADFTGYTAAGQTCYHFTQKHLRTYPTLPLSVGGALGAPYAHGANGNVVLVYYLETLQREPNAPGVYAYSLQTLDGTAAAAAKGTAGGLTINNNVFKLYRVPVSN